MEFTRKTPETPPLSGETPRASGSSSPHAGARCAHRLVHTGGLGLAFGSITAILALACGPGRPPPHVVEVPIDQFSGAGGPAVVHDTSAPTTAVEAAPEPAGGGSTPSPSPSPSPLPTNDTATGAAPGPAVPTFGPHTKPPRGQRLLAADCGRLMDKYIQLVAVGQGLSPVQATKAVPAMKAQVQNDPNYAIAQSECVDQTSRKQYACGMKATTVDAWKACVQ